MATIPDVIYGPCTAAIPDLAGKTCVSCLNGVSSSVVALRVCSVLRAIAAPCPHDWLEQTASTPRSDPSLRSVTLLPT